MEKVSHIFILVTASLMFVFAILTTVWCIALSQELSEKADRIISLQKEVNNYETSLSECTEAFLRANSIVERCNAFIESIEKEVNKPSKKTYHCQGTNGSCSVDDYLRHKAEKNKQRELDSEEKKS